VGDARLLIQIHQIALQIWVVDDTPQIAFEMAVIDDVESNECAKKSPVRLDNAIPKQVASFRQTLFEFVQRLKKSAASNLVGPLARGETSSVNAIVYIVVQKLRKRFLFGCDFGRKKIYILIPGELIKHIIEHAADIVLTIVHDPFRFRVPEHRYCHALVEIRIGSVVSFAEKVKAVDRVG